MTTRLSLNATMWALGLSPMRHTLAEKIAANPPEVLTLPSYDRSRTRVGIVHFGPGAFHRAHQAVYTDDILAHHPDWAICGVSLRSPKLRDALAKQDNLYTLTLLGNPPRYRLIGSIKELLVAPESPQAVLSRLENETIRVVTSTVTEKGYCLTSEGDLDTTNEHVKHDLTTPSNPSTFVGYIVEGLRRRRDAGVPPFTPVSCDNLAENGKKLRRAALKFAHEINPDLASWIEAEVAFPCTMVDSITPATDDDLRAQVASDLGFADYWPVMREPFSQWIIEDVFTDRNRPPWDEAGAIYTDKVAPYEDAKLKLLNGSHSALAYLGMLAGKTTVAGAMSVLEPYVEALMRDEICPGLDAPTGLDLTTYCQQIRDRFRDPCIEYQLSQIAWDGSQKIPIRLLRTIEANLNNGVPVRLLSLAVAAWMLFSVKAAREGLPVTDPLKDRILAIARAATGDAEADVSAFLTLTETFPSRLRETGGFEDGLVRAYRTLNVNAPKQVLHAIQRTTAQ